MHTRLSRIPEFCAAYAVGRTTAYKLIADGDIEAVKVNNSTRITVESAEAWAASLPKKGSTDK